MSPEMKENCNDACFLSSLGLSTIAGFYLSGMAFGATGAAILQKAGWDVGISVLESSLASGLGSMLVGTVTGTCASLAMRSPAGLICGLATNVILSAPVGLLGAEMLGQLTTPVKIGYTAAASASGAIIVGGTLLVIGGTCMVLTQAGLGQAGIEPRKELVEAVHSQMQLNSSDGLTPEQEKQLAEAANSAHQLETAPAALTPAFKEASKGNSFSLRDLVPDFGRLFSRERSDRVESAPAVA